MLSKQEYIELVLNELGYQNKFNNRIISQLTIQKVMYMIYVYYLINYETLSNELEFEAWEFGPVIRELWYKFNNFGSLKIELPYDINIYNKYKGIHNIKIIRKICDLLTRIEIFDIVNSIHKSDIWAKNYKPLKNIIMTNKMIMEYYHNNDNDLMIYLRERL